MKKRIDYLINMEKNGVVDPEECYHGTLKEAKRAARSLYKKEIKRGWRVIIKVGETVVAEYNKEEGWVDFLEIVDKES